ncbi:MAG: DUF1194 domain-containing protein [Hyphomicrobiaceae bacterium]
MSKDALATRREILRRSVLAPAGLAAGIAAGGTRPALADAAVDLKLVLAVDASGSVNEVRFELQKRGYVAAFRNSRVIKAVQSGAAGGIGVTMMQWTGPDMQAMAVPWSVVRDAATAESFARAIERGPRQLFGGGTSISGAIDHGVALLGACPFSGGRRVIDVSGDGANNRGRPAHEARDDAVAKEITINGLPILSIEPFLDRHYKSDVIGGVNAFMVVASSYEEFSDAILKKMITEIAAVDPDMPGVIRPVPTKRG